VPGLLSFREIPAVVEALAALARTPDRLLADGQGLAHPRRSVSPATWAGCSTRRLSVSPSPAARRSHTPPDRRCVWSPLLYRGDLVGAAVRTRRGVKPVFVSRATASTWQARCG
jgi:deoxyribonuclease V